MRIASRRGFTLVELMVSMVIILLLVGFSLPIFSISIREAKKKKAEEAIRSLVIALRSYYREYNEWRPGLNSGDIDMTMVQMLRGENPGGLNPHQRRFLEINYSQINSRGYMDPWGRPYQYTVDADYDGVIEHDGEQLHIDLGICSAGEDPEDPEDDLWSWE
ncbi:MAG: type II secretion system protein [Verrucomicrobiota bacterium]